MTPKQLEFIYARSKSWHIFEGNYEDFRDACEDLANPTQPNPTQPNPTQPNPTQPNPTQPNPTRKHSHNDKFWIMHEDAYSRMLGLERKFHNFLASAKTLVDHSRVLMKNYSGTEFFEVLEKKIEQVGSSSIVKFCHDLRNYFLHQKNPSDNYFIHQTWYENENLIVTRGYVRISKSSLDEYSN